jgi:NAD-dependent deacetylase
MDADIEKAAQWIRQSKHATVFTGAGISVESEIPPFRGEGGLWNKYDPAIADISYFRAHPQESWQWIKEIFYDGWGSKKPNRAHQGIAELEKMGFVKAVITQNIDCLHQGAGSRTVYEFHGTLEYLICGLCRDRSPAREVPLDNLPPRCGQCGGILRPDFVFFGEGIPEPARSLSFQEAWNADVFLVIGTTGEVMPACQIPVLAKNNYARIIEINIAPSTFTHTITDIFLKGKATEIMEKLCARLR